MDLLKKIKSLFKQSASSPKDNRAYWVFVRCQACGELLRARVDLHNDLSAQFSENGTMQSYFCRKVLVGGKRCYRPIDVELTFDPDRNLIDRQIRGGVFVTEEDFYAAQGD